MLPAKAQAVLQQALQHHNAGRVAQAASLYAELRRGQPNGFDGHHLGGVAALQLGKPAEAASLLQRAQQLRPNSAPTLMCLGLAQVQLGKAAEAEDSLRESLRLDAKNFEAWSNLGAVLSHLGKLKEAAEAYRASTKLQPKHAASWTGLGCVLHVRGESKEAIQILDTALRLDPKEPKAQLVRAQAWQGLHDTERALTDFDGHLARFPGDHEAASLRLCVLNYLDRLSREQLFEEHKRFGQRFPAPPALPNRSDISVTPPGSKKRIGFLSPDLRTHSVTHFLEPLLRHFNRDAFELYLYHDHFNVDETSRRLAGYAASWTNFTGQSHERVEAQLRADQLDCLIDLAGHTGGNRLPVFARRVAPVQITYLGYPNTTGLQTMDYRFTDAIADPVGDVDVFATEKLIRFSSCAWAYQPPGDAPDVSPAPAPAAGKIAFGSFNNLAKVNAYSLRLWAQVLDAVPNSTLLLKSHSAKDSAFHVRLVQSGLPLDRVTVLPANPRTVDHLAAYAQVDIALDPFPYHGTTTTCEALWMGVPVITLCGDRHASRVGASLLTAVGHSDWIAYSPADYVALAQRLAADLPKLAHTRARLREDLRRSILLDHAGQAARFSEAIQSLVSAKPEAPDTAASVALR